MVSTVVRYRLSLLGPFRLLNPASERIEIPSKKGIAVIAMLAMAKKGEQTRGWLQDKLWGKRRRAEAGGSLRRELSTLRRHLNGRSEPLLICERDRVRLDLNLIEVDTRNLAPDQTAVDEFLEGLDIPGEDGFEMWLREQRRALFPPARRLHARVPPHAPLLPAHIIDTAQPPPGFDGIPALAVLAFTNATGEEDNDYLAEGISEELIDR
jgi:hypothetical protein